MAAAPRGGVDVLPASLGLGAGPSFQISHKKQNHGPGASSHWAEWGKSGTTSAVSVEGQPWEGQMAGAADAATGWLWGFWQVLLYTAL